MDCIFCKIATHEIPAMVVYEDDHVIAFEDIQKVAPIHTLVVPKMHLTSIIELPYDNTALLTSIQKAILHITKTTGVDQSGFRVITNYGTSAGQTVFHLHYHIIGGRDLQVSLG